MRRATVWRGCAAVVWVACAQAFSACASSGQAYGPPAAMARQAPGESSGGASMDAAPSVQEPSDAPSPAAAARAAVGGVAGRETTGTAGHGPGSGTEGRNPTGPQGTPPAGAQAPAAPMLIYEAQVDLMVPAAQIAHTLDQVIEVAAGMGGYLARRTDTSVQVRIPSARFREGLGRVEDLGEVLHRSVTADDVSEEFRDMEVRLANLRAVRRRLEEFLQRAGSMQEALTVERELERVTAEIDRIEGRMRFLSARAAFSLVTVNVAPRPAVVVPPPPPPPLIPPRRLPSLPVQWLQELGLDRLLHIGEGS